MVKKVQKQTLEIEVITDDGKKPKPRRRPNSCLALFAGIAAITELCIGAIVMVVFIFALWDMTVNVHSICCTIAYAGLVAHGVLTLSRITPLSSTFRISHRKAIHAFFQIGALILGIYGTGETIARMGVVLTAHSISGFVVHILQLLALCLSPFTMLKWPLAKLLHKFVGIGVVIGACVAMVSGILTPVFTDWAHDAVPPLLIIIVIFSTAVIVLVPFIRIARAISTVNVK